MVNSPLLFLCHRIPFPPNKGDKIATFNLLKYLSKRYQVHLGYFIDDDHDIQYIEKLRPYCVSSFDLNICDKRQAVSGVNALLSNSSISTSHYRSTAFQNWVDRTIAQFKINKLYVYSSAMAQFIDHARYQKKTRILNMTDIDSDKWRQYAQSKPWYTKWIYAREHRQLGKYEQQVLQNFNAVTLVTEQEAELFCQMSPPLMNNKIHTLTNGVDTDYFSPNADFEQLIASEAPILCFTGAMDYWANVDAMLWFCDHIWPQILKQHPQCQLYIVGGNPTAKVMALAQRQGVTVTGRVPDVRPYLEVCQLVVAPMRIARGVQNKVLEAMAMAKPVVMTSMAQEGIKINQQQAGLVIDEPMQMAQSINKLLSGPSACYQHNRQWILNHYSWDGALKTLPSLIDAHYS
ncbi:MAG: TIGR03087 family PEP-CTERM/XrtA system glycosyltransferase [Gammaproteobacteria bacterium]|nr:TIGR03087 family PEP-CTERM/XrtA system glycosyltransferase [Gammaproteobacteria bacterium]